MGGGARSKPRTTLRIKIGLARSGGGVLVPSQGGLDAASGAESERDLAEIPSYSLQQARSIKAQPQGMGAHAGEVRRASTAEPDATTPPTAALFLGAHSTRHEAPHTTPLLRQRRAEHGGVGWGGVGVKKPLRQTF